jgi:hypothetical protein
VKARGLVIAGLLVLVATTGGCGDKGHHLTGQLTIDGTAPSLQPNQVIKISLVPADPAILESMPQEDRAELTTSVRNDGSFSVASVPPGRYFVTVADFPIFPHGDRLAAHFRSHPQSIEFDLVEPRPIDVNVMQAWYTKSKK